MRKNTLNINDIKENILKLKGQMVELKVNRGRKKIDQVNGKIQDIYPSVFTVSVPNQKIQTFSYFDVLCGNIIFK